MVNFRSIFAWRIFKESLDVFFSENEDYLLGEMEKSIREAEKEAVAFKRTKTKKYKNFKLNKDVKK